MCGSIFAIILVQLYLYAHGETASPHRICSLVWPRIPLVNGCVSAECKLSAPRVSHHLMFSLLAYKPKYIQGSGTTMNVMG